jgi:hypothetical protein
MAGLNGFSSGIRNGGMLSGILGGINGLSTGVSPEGRTANALAGRGVDPGLAQTIARDPELMRAVLSQILGLAGKTIGAPPRIPIGQSKRPVTINGVQIHKVN